MKYLFSKQQPFFVRLCTVVVVSVYTLSFFSFTVTSKLTGDLWQQLGIAQLQGTEKIKNTFFNNHFDSYGVRNFKNIVAGDRAAVAKDLLSYTKQYIGSAAFKNNYEQWRNEAKPVASDTTQPTKEDIRKQKIEEAKEGIKNTEELLKTTPAEMKETLQTILELHKNNLKEYEDPNSAMIDLFYQGEVYAHQSSIEQYNTAIKSWEENYPADYREFIKTRLQKYLDIATTVDFSAELTEKNGKKVFVNTAYEAKSDEWKMIFRAGKEVYDVAKPFAAQWIKELQPAATASIF